jgi:hypothetical protein
MDGGRSSFEGGREITALDGNKAAGVLVDTSVFDFDANGLLDAVRC